MSKVAFETCIVKHEESVLLKQTEYNLLKISIICVIFVRFLINIVNK